MNLEVSRVFGYRGEKIHALGGGEYVHVAATGLLFGSSTGVTTLWTPTDGTREVTALCFHPKHSLFVCAEKRLKVNLLVIAYPSKKPLQRIPDVARLGIVDAAFSRDGSILAILSDAPTHNLSLFHVDSNNKLTLACQQTQPLPHQTTFVSINPRTPTEICTSGGGHAIFWTHDKVANIVQSCEGKVSTPSVRLTCHLWLPSSRVVCGTQRGDLYTFDFSSGIGTLCFTAEEESCVAALALSSHHLVAATQDGTVRFHTLDGRQIIKTVRLPSVQLTNMTFTPEWNTLYVGGADGVLFLVHLPNYEDATLSDRDFAAISPRVTPLVDFGGSKVVGVRIVESTYTILSSDGTLRIIDSDNVLISKLHVGDSPTSFESGNNETKRLLLVGNSNGCLRLVDISDARNPKVALRVKVAKCAISQIKCNEAGTLATIVVHPCDIVCFSLRSRDVTAVTTVDEKLEITDFVWVGDQTILVALNNGDIHQLGTSNDSAGFDSAVDFDKLLINTWRLDFPAQAIALASLHDESMQIVAVCADKETKVFSLDRTLPPDRKDLKPLKVVTSAKDHDKCCNCALLSQRKYLFTGGADGRLCVRDVAGICEASQPHTKAVVHANRHVPTENGIVSVSCSSDSQHILTGGGDGYSFLWYFAKSQKQHHRAFRIVEQPPLVRDVDEEMFFVDQRKQHAREIDLVTHATHRDGVKRAVDGLRDRLCTIRKENEESQADEKVDLTDFLPPEDRRNFMEKCSEATNQMKDEVRFSNLNRDFLIEKIKQQCWETMDTKLTPIHSLVPSHDIEVFNFHSRQVDKRELALLRKLKFLRRVEQLDRQASGIVELHDIKEKKEDAPEQKAAEIRPFEVFDEAEGMKPRATLESESCDDVGPFLYDPLLVFTRHRAIIQIFLLHARVRFLKASFNAEFREMQEKKKNEIGKIEERNVRSRQVLKELEEKGDLFVVKQHDSERPELLLTVKDDEISADKSADPEERKRVQNEELEKERWRRQHGSDDSSDRALKLWMDGRLEKEERLLDINVQLPDFADEKSGKFVAVEERNEEQQKIFKDYEKRLAKRTEEVALRRKTLQGELMQLQKDNAETAKAFDVAVQSLLMKRLEYSRHCFEVDLIQLKLAQSIVFQEERKKVARRLEQQSQVMTEKLLRASKATKAVRDELEAKKKLADELEASEKLKEKNMRSMPPFSDHEEHAELLYKLYVKRKPKKEKFGAKKEDKKAKSKPQEVEVPSMDPFAFIEREEEAKRKMLAADDAFQLPRIDKPEGIPDSLWEAFQNYRQDRVDAEKEKRRMHDEILELTKEELRLSTIEEELRQAAEESIKHSHSFRQDSLKDQRDIDQLFVFRQGQVEVEQAPVVTDYADAILIVNDRITRLNELIKESGAEKVELLRGIAEKRTEIHVINWDIERLQYQMRMLEMEYRHLHTLRVTKQMQEFINGGGEDHNEKQRQKLAKKIEHVRTSMSTKIDARKLQMLKYRRMMKDKDMENSLLMEQVSEAKAIVDDREAIHGLQSSELDKERNNRLMKDMRVTRKLEDVAKAQQEEMIALKKEIDRLRERTFPSFAVVSKRVVGNPDQA